MTNKDAYKDFQIRLKEVTPIIEEIVKEGFQNKGRKKSRYEMKCEIIERQNRHWHS